MTGFLITLFAIWAVGAAIGILFGAAMFLEAVDDKDTELAARSVLSGVLFPLAFPFLLYFLFKNANLLPEGIKWH